MPTETQRPARSRDPPRAGELPLRKRQGAGSPGSVLAKVELWTNAVQCGHPSTLKEAEINLRNSCAAQQCPQSDSNRHLADFKSAASADWAMGARDECSASTAEA